MAAVLEALGRPVSVLSRLLLVGQAGATILAFLVLGSVLASHLPALVVHLIFWTAWFLWLAVLFPANRHALMTRAPEDAYPRAFSRHIVPGFSLIASQLLRPLWVITLSWDAVAAPFPTAAGAFLVAIAGAVLMVCAVRTLTFAGAAFLYEYVQPMPPQRPVGVYAMIRHPIWVGGIIATTAAAVPFWRSGPLALAAVNVLLTPVYGRLEDVRLSKVFGHVSIEYRQGIQRFNPFSLGALIRRSFPRGVPHTALESQPGRRHIASRRAIAAARQSPTVRVE